jgi:hypothetical protein
MSHSKLHNPKYVGPGLWYGIHIDAANAKNVKDKIKSSNAGTIFIVLRSYRCRA